MRSERKSKQKINIIKRSLSVVLSALMITALWAGSPPVSAATGDPIAFPQFLMSVQACGEELVSASNAATNAIDGIPATFWHTPWSGHPMHGANQGTGTNFTGITAANGHWIMVDLGSEQTVQGIRYLPRPNGGNGTFTSVRIYHSLNGTAFTLAGTAAWANNGAEKIFDFPAAANAKYVMLFATAAAGNFGSCAEFNVVVSDRGFSDTWTYARAAIERLNGVVNLPGLEYFSEAGLAEAIAIVRSAANQEFAAARPIIDAAVDAFFDTVIASILDPSMAPPVFSAHGGFFDEEFPLTITGGGEGYIIRYTINGASPTLSSSLYEGPITIRNRPVTDAPMTQAYVNRHFGGNSANMRNQLSVMVVTARVFAPNGRFSPPTTHTYFVGENFASMFDMPILAASLEPDDFAGPRGMYTDYRGNHRPHGFVEFFEADGTLGFRRFAEMRVAGHGSLGDRKKTMQWNFNSHLNPPHYGRYLHYDIIPNTFANYNDPLRPVTSFARVRARIADWTGTTVREQLTASVALPLRPDIHNNRHTAIFINGEFWGVYPLREQFNDDFVYLHYGIPRNQVIQLDIDWDTRNPYFPIPPFRYRYDPQVRLSFSEGPAAYEMYYYENFMAMYNAIVGPDLTIQENFDYIKTYLCMDNLIDWFIVYYFFENDDWPGNNFRFCRTHTVNDEIYGHDGRWRFVIHDFDISMSSTSRDRMQSFTVQGNQMDARQPFWAVEIWRSLFTSPEFREILAARYATYLGTTFNPQVTLPILESIVNEAMPGIQHDFMRWNLHGGGADAMTRWYNNAIGASVNAGLRRYLNERGEWSLGHIRRYYNHHFGLGSPAPNQTIPGQAGETRGMFTSINFLSDAAMGFFNISGAEIRPWVYGMEMASDFTANYIRRLPINIEANALEGYAFDRFEITIGGNVQTITENPMVFTPDDTGAAVVIRAFYSEEPTQPDTVVLTAEIVGDRIEANLFNGLDETIEANLILAVYSEDGRLGRLITLNETVASGSAFATDFGFDANNYPDSYYFKVFVLDNDSIPMAEAVELR